MSCRVYAIMQGNTARPHYGNVASPTPLHKPLSTRTVGKSTNVRWHDAQVLREDKERLLGQRGCVLWFTGGTRMKIRRVRG